MRGDTRNRGLAPTLAWKPPSIAESAVFRFRTGNGVFSTPVIDMDERIYVGSADRKFYAIDPLNDIELWHVDVGGIIDSAACIDDVKKAIYLACGDGKIHAFSMIDGRELWNKDFLRDRSKDQFSLSSNYWFEANIVLGPDGFLYAANDDFYLYKISPDDGSIVWGYRTGFLVWSAPSFSSDGCVYLPGFDHDFHVLDMETGKLRWKIDLRGALVSSAAVGDDGTIFVASFNGNVYAIDPGKDPGNRKGKRKGISKGTIKWTFPTGGHVYASPAVAPDGVIYIGSTSGTFYAIDAVTGIQRWSYYIGDAIRCSASVGPDPERAEPYLVYVGGGDGVLYAMTPSGKIRWSYDIMSRASEIDYPNINASIALGNAGLATASAGGDVIWIPYNYYLVNPDDPGFVSGGLFTAKSPGASWHLVTPGGKVDHAAVDAAALPAQIFPVSTVSLRLLMHGESGVSPVEVDPGTLKVEPAPPFAFRVELQSDRCTINVIPLEILQPGLVYRLNVSVVYRHGGRPGMLNSSIPLVTAPETGETSIVSFPGKVFNIVKMAIPQPPIIPSLNQIGFASLVIPFTIIAHDPATRSFVAWAVQEFADYVPMERVSVYAFSGKYQGDFFTMEAKNCNFEITSFTISLDMLRFAGKIEPDGIANHGGSLVVDKYWGTKNLKILSSLGSSSPITAGIMLKHLKVAGAKRFFPALFQMTRSLLRILLRDTWTTWGLVNHRHQLIGVGTFKIRHSGRYIETRPNANVSCTVESFIHDKPRKRFSATVSCPASAGESVIRIIIIDTIKTMAIPINYNARNKVQRRGEKIVVVLTVPKQIDLQSGAYQAMLMHGLQVLATLDLC
ncbi:MAG: PQQ-binding-like beta-propeller repeat protein [Candidatus Sigynarchaeum springense]